MRCPRPLREIQTAQEPIETHLASNNNNIYNNNNNNYNNNNNNNNNNNKDKTNGFDVLIGLLWSIFLNKGDWNPLTSEHRRKWRQDPMKQVFHCLQMP